MKVLLINPPYFNSKYKFIGLVAPPLGIAYMAAVLEENSIDVKIIDAAALEMSWETLETEIKRISIGCPSIFSPWKEKIIINVKRRPIMVYLSNAGINSFNKNSSPLFLLIIFLVIILNNSGTTIYKIIDNNNVPQGILIFPTFNKKLTIGI